MTFDAMRSNGLHTPGPYHRTNVGEIRAEDGTILAEVKNFNAPGRHRDVFEITATANLLAASAELLSALEGLVERGTDSPQHRAAEAAIAKAHGLRPTVLKAVP